MISVLNYEKPDSVSKEEWLEKIQSTHLTRTDLNRLVMDYLVTEGFKEAADKFQEEAGIEPNIETESLTQRINIRSTVEEGKVQEAISMVNDLHPELLDNNRYLYFHLQQQHVIELIREHNIEAALDYAQTHLAERAKDNPEILTELERTLALLAFEEPGCSPYGDLLNGAQRRKVASELNGAILEAENKNPIPKVASLLKLLMWSQDELDARKVKYPRMSDISTGALEEQKSPQL